jgi:hypothetical protein
MIYSQLAYVANLPNGRILLFRDLASWLFGWLMTLLTEF